MLYFIRLASCVGLCWLGRCGIAWAMIRLLINPFVLFCLLLGASWLGFIESSQSGKASSALLSILATLLLLAFLCNASLAVARMVAHRASLSLVGWAVAYLCLGSVLSPLYFAPSEQKVDESFWDFSSISEADAAHAEAILLLRAAARGDVSYVSSLIPSRYASSSEPAAAAAVVAIEYAALDVLESLLSEGLPTAALWQEQSLLSSALLYKNRKALKMLLEAGASPDERDVEGNTLLTQAVLGQDSLSVDILRSFGANPQLQNSDASLPSSYARDDRMFEKLSKDIESSR